MLPVICAAAALCFLAGCGRTRDTEVTRLIGVSLANQTDEWRSVLKEELQDEADQYEGVELIFLDAGDDVEKQMSDLNELVGYGAELLIVSPVDVESLIAPVEQMYYDGVPILLLDRAVKGFDYTCFFGVDDKILARKEAAALPLVTGKAPGEATTVLNIIMDNYTGRQRAQLFRNAVADNTEVRQIIVVSGTRDATEDTLLERPSLLDGVDIIITQNDYMAQGAARACDALGMGDIRIMGCDGFSGENGGIEMVREGIIDATIVCPTGGREAISYAVNYFDGMTDGPKQINLRNVLVTADNADGYVKESDDHRIMDISSVGYVQIDEDTGFRRANTDSYLSAAAEHGIMLDIVECRTVEEQFSAFERFLESDMDAIILSPIVEDGWKDLFEKARQKGVPVILSDREVNLDDDLYTAFVGADFLEEGARCMRWIEDNMQGEQDVRILELAGTRNSSPAIGRGMGFRDMMRGRSGYTIVASLVGDFSREKGYSIIKDYLDDHGRDFDVIFCHNDDMMLGAVEAIREAGLEPGSDIKLLSIDGTKDALLALQSGEANFVAECTPLLGENAMRAIEELRKGEEVPVRVISSEGTFDEDVPDTVLRNRKY